MKYSILCIFTPLGKTFTFRNVEMVCDNETVLQFNYSAMTDGKAKMATFPKANLCGWSLTPEQVAGVGDPPALQLGGYVTDTGGDAVLAPIM